MVRITLCPACEKLFKDAYILRKLPLNERELKATCDYCGNRVVLMDTFEVMGPKRMDKQ